jgi:hypothetical protein
MHLMRLGVHAEQQYFVQNQEKFDLLVLNANLAQYFASGTASLIVGKLPKKPFIIDPITHAFGQPTRYIRNEAPPGELGSVKAALEGLAGAYGSPITRALHEQRQLIPRDLQSPDELRGFTDRVLRFQEHALLNALGPSDAKYIDGNPQDILRPQFLVAPYFYMKASDAPEWLPVNLHLVRASRELLPKHGIYAEIVIDRGILDSIDEVDHIARAYRDANECDGYLLWVSDHSEHESALSTLRGLKRLVATLAESGKNVISLYGGYFSLLLSQFGAAGLCHGPGYGEERNVIPVGGGLPTSKFYVTPVHQRLLFREVQFMVAADAWPDADTFFQEVCSGETCREVISGNLKENFHRFGEEIVKERKGRSYSFQAPEARVLTTNHFIEAKHQEFRHVTETSLPDLIAQLRDAKLRYEPFIPGAQLRYLDSWVHALAD